MNEKIDIDVKTLRPFTRFIYTIGELPTSYLMSMTYEEQLIWLCNYLKETVIPTVNNNAEAVKEVQDIVMELQDYINNYFDNLDVQEEINNKLDDMAESGQLTDIIAQYLGLAGMLMYNTVADMKQAENLVEGSFTKTLGYYSLNDGGSSTYKIRKITNSDIVDEATLIALNDETLVAELIITPCMNVIQFGINEENECSTLLQAIIDLSIVNEIDLMGLTLSIETKIDLKSDLIIKNGTISATNLVNIIEGSSVNHFEINNIYFNGNNNCQRGIYLATCNNFIISGCKFYDFEILTGGCCGINTHSCKYGKILLSEFYDIGNNSVGDASYEPRGIILENSTYINVENCYIHDIFETTDHGDGIQFLSHINREMSNNIIKDCVIEDCIYRGIKIQQRGVTVDHCVIKEGTNDRSLQQSGIAVYDSDITIKNSYISQKCDTAIAIGSATTPDDLVNNVNIDGNIFDFKNSLNFGVISIPYFTNIITNLNITNNKFNILDENKKPYSIVIFGKFNGINVVNNSFKGGEVFLAIKKATGDNNQSKQNLVVVGNNGTTKQSLVIFDENVEISKGSITGNNAFYDTPLQFVSGQNSVRTYDVTQYKSFKISNNHISSGDSTVFYDGPRNIGGTTSRPSTAVNNGFMYFDVNLNQYVTYYNGSWYLPDGTVSS